MFLLDSSSTRLLRGSSWVKEFSWAAVHQVSKLEKRKEGRKSWVAASACGWGSSRGAAARANEREI